MVYGEFCNLRQMQFAIRLLLIMIIPLMPIFTLLWLCFDESVSFIYTRRGLGGGWRDELIYQLFRPALIRFSSVTLVLCLLLLLVRRYSITPILPRECGTTIKFYWPFSLAHNKLQQSAVYFHRQQFLFPANNCARCPTRCYYSTKFYCSLNNATVTNGGAEPNLLHPKFLKCEKNLCPTRACYYANSVAAF